jgi:hypothetical protein
MNQTIGRTRSLVRKLFWLPILVAAAGACSRAASSSDGAPTSDAGTTTDDSAVLDAETPPVDAGVTVDLAPPSSDATAPVDTMTPPPVDAASAPDGAKDAMAGVDAAPVDKQTLFYLDVQGRVMSADPAKPAAHTVVASAGKGPDGIAIDQAAGFIYWTTMGVPADNDGTVMRARLDGSQVTTLIAKGDTYTPKQLKIDVGTHQMYWSDREGMRVQRANLDGSQLETLVTVGSGDKARADNANFCVGIALDLAGGWFYWTQKGPDNGKVGSIRRAHVAMPAGETSTTRTDIELLWAGLPEPIDLDVDVEGGFLYWTDRGDDTVSRGPIAMPAGATAASRTDRQILVRNVREAIGVVVDRPHGVIYYTSATGQVGRAGLDGTGATDLLTKAGALTGIVVVDGL